MLRTVPEYYLVSLVLVLCFLNDTTQHKKQHTIQSTAFFLFLADDDSLSLSHYPAPCPPLNPTGRLDCVTNAAWVSWDNSDNSASLSYTVVAESVAGDHSSNCSALPSDPSCGVGHLKCGTEYVMYVEAANDVCQNVNSSSFILETGSPPSTLIQSSVRGRSRCKHCWFCSLYTFLQTFTTVYYCCMLVFSAAAP